jgi:hypothetical protein
MHARSKLLAPGPGHASIAAPAGNRPRPKLIGAFPIFFP